MSATATTSDATDGLGRASLGAVTLALLAMVTFGVGTGVWLGGRRIVRDLGEARGRAMALS